MPKKLTKQEIVERVERLMSGRWSEEEVEAILREISENVPCPYADIQGYVFHATDDPSAETIVDRMLARRPIRL
jgi:hypothetical protein